MIEVGLLGLLEMGFSEFEIFFVWIGCVVFLDYFGALGFDDFVGFEKMGILRFLIFGF